MSWPKMDHRSGRVIRYQFGAFLALASVWELIGRSSPYWHFLVASPTSVCREFVDLVLRHALWQHFIITGSEAVLGLAIGTLMGSVAGLLLWFSPTIGRVAKPFVLVLGTVPILAFAPLMIVWFGVGFWMKVVLAAFSTVFLAFNEGYRGAGLVADEYVEALRGLNATRVQIFWKVIVPGSLDGILASMRFNVGLALLGAFIGEFIASDRGLGYLILRASGLYNIPRALAAGIGIVLLGILLDSLGHAIEKRRYVLIQWLSVPRAVWSK